MRFLFGICSLICLSFHCAAMPFSWKVLDSAPPELVSKIVVDWREPGVIVAIAQSGSLYGSSDWGDSWTARQTPDGLPVYLLSLDHTNERSWYGLTATSGATGIWRSGDACASWNFISNIPGHIETLAVSPFVPGLMLATVSSGAGSEITIHKSTDAGITWQGIFSSVFTRSPVFWHRTSPWQAHWNTQMTTDYGETWTNNSIRETVTCGAEIPPRLYSVSSEGLFYSQDNLKSWWPLFLEPVSFIAINPRNSHQLLTGIQISGDVQSGTIFFSDDLGDTFIEWTNGADAGFHSVVFASDWMFFGIKDGIVYRYDERPADIDGSGRVDGGDLVILSLAFGTALGEPQFNERADLNADRAVDGNDLVILSLVWGHNFIYDDTIPPGDFGE